MNKKNLNKIKEIKKKFILIINIKLINENILVIFNNI